MLGNEMTDKKRLFDKLIAISPGCKSCIFDSKCFDSERREEAVGHNICMDGVMEEAVERE